MILKSLEPGRLSACLRHPKPSGCADHVKRGGTVDAEAHENARRDNRRTPYACTAVYGDGTPLGHEASQVSCALHGLIQRRRGLLIDDRKPDELNAGLPAEGSFLVDVEPLNLIGFEEAYHDLDPLVRPSLDFGLQSWGRPRR